jgi:flagellar M-ring protein FliF
MLAEVLGSDRAIVRVDATLNFEKIESEREIFDPQGAVVRSEERQEANDPDTGGADESSITNYEINRTVERIVGETGGIKQLSVAVFVDGTWEPAAEGGEQVYQPLDDDELTRIRRLVSTAVGLNAVRGDQIEVENMPFAGGGESADAGPALPRWLELIPDQSGRVLLLALLAVLLFSFRRNLRALVGELAGERPSAAGAGTDHRGESAEKERFEGLPDMTDQMIEDVQEYAAENPERVAEVIQSWIYKDDRNRGARTMGGTA